MGWGLIETFREMYRGMVHRSVRECVICGWRGRRFHSGGAPNKRRFDCVCPRCRSTERHRLAFVVAQEAPLDFQSVLHVAPEPCLSAWLKQSSADYLSIDLYHKAMVKMDLTKLDLPNCTRTLVWASHVLEHIEDDRTAISEIYRVLKPGGAAVIQVPIWRSSTFEDSSRRTEAERRTYFYQADHVRLYGMDIISRFEDAGFRVDVHHSQDLGPDRLIRHALSFASTNEVFILRKPRDSPSC